MVHLSWNALPKGIQYLASLNHGLTQLMAATLEPPVSRCVSGAESALRILGNYIIVPPQTMGYIKRQIQSLAS